VIDFDDLVSKDRAVAVVGLGYVGLPLPVALSRHFRVTRFDIPPARLDQLRAGTPRTGVLDPPRPAPAPLPSPPRLPTIRTHRSSSTGPRTLLRRTDNAMGSPRHSPPLTHAAERIVVTGRRNRPT